MVDKLTQRMRQAIWRKQHPERDRAYGVKSRAGAKLAALAAYGRICQCCGKSDPKFLALDHIENDGKTHRKGREGQGFYSWLRKRLWPPGLQVLCHNCNNSKRDGSSCHHDNLNGLVMTGAAFNKLWGMCHESQV